MSDTAHHAADTVNDVEELVNRLFADKVDHNSVREAESSPLLRDLWDTVASLGLPGIGIAEAAGGSGGSLADVVTLLTAAGRHAVPLPLLEHHLALWLVTVSGGQVEEGAPWTVAPPPVSLTVEGTTVTGTLSDVAWGGAAERVVALAGTGAEAKVLVLDPADAEVRAGRDLAGQPRDVLTFDGATAEVLPSAVTTEQLAQRGAVLRAAQMAGSMSAVHELTQRYTAEREQFGRPIGTFQSIRTHLVFLAQMAVMTQVSVDRAAAALASGRDASFAAYAAKLLADQNAAVSVKSGHQAHGAIGMTREYALQDHTRRLNAWRGDWGSEQALADRIGAAVIGARGIATIATDEGVLSVCVK
ncbi:acyl-CoA dehydrogenase family protein [Streptomyces sp. RY43-2]|uniref:Acyl-CoA dehydrogenase family protein n=1 Tax=Streptomyces macrolidinus TaxID=2952607 RepID=A0ABT0ZFK4_9ACTN|nr:acyl-CoA dehydrogenase [Streptomyces macrolidinus]MCN9242359.1 acyl-CoA dehydrogenase family protein [Streptomyces macrolidinus]